MSTQDCLQQLFDETPESSLYYKQLQAFSTRPAADCHIVICGLANVGKSDLVKVLSLSRTLSATDGSPAAIVPRYIDTPGFDLSGQQSAQAWEKAIGADIIVLIHDMRQGALAAGEMAFLQSLKARFPDLCQRMIMVLAQADKVPCQMLERLSAIHRNLAMLFLSCSGGIPDESYPAPAKSGVPVLLLEPSRIQALRQQLLLLIGSYEGGLPGMRTASSKALLDTLDAWVTGAIKIRKKRIAIKEAELSQTFSLWQRDLQRLGDTLRFRINELRQR